MTQHRLCRSRPNLQSVNYSMTLILQNLKLKLKTNLRTTMGQERLSNGYIGTRTLQIELSIWKKSLMNSKVIPL